MPRDPRSTPPPNPHPPPTIPAADAAYAMVLYLYAIQRAQHGEHLSHLTACNIAAIARILDIHPQRSASELGFDPRFRWSPEAMVRTMAQPRDSDTAPLIRRLFAAISGLSVADLDAFEAPAPAPEPSGTLA